MELSDAEAGHDDVFESYESPRKKMKRHKGGSERIIIPRLNQVLLEDMCTFVKLPTCILFTGCAGHMLENFFNVMCLFTLNVILILLILRLSLPCTSCQWLL